MKKALKWVIPVGIVLILFIWIKNVYNKLVTMDENVIQQWSQVENVYQRKYDLIPNLVSVAKNYADFEKETLTAVVEARAKATSITIDPANLTEESMAQFQAAQDQLNGALSRLLLTFERYPDLKANQNYLELQAELAGTENRIAVERKKFTEAVRNYNITVRRFPNNIIAGIFGFEKKANFKAEEAAEGGKVDVEELFDQ